MPVEFLTDEQAARFGRFADQIPSQAELERFFFLDDADHTLVERRRGAHNRLGFAVQLGTVRYVGTFLADPLEVPTGVVDFLAAQLEITDASCVKAYGRRPATQWEHTAELRREFGYRDFGEATEQVREFLAARAWTRVETAKALFDAAVAWLWHQRVLLPGASVLARLVAEHRERAAEQLHTTLHQAAGTADVELPARLTGLLAVPDGKRVSELERLRKGPTRVSGRSMTQALDRASELAGLGAGEVDVSTVPANRLEALARDGLADAIETVEELAPPEADDDAAWRTELVDRWHVVRPFLPLLAQVIPFGATPARTVVLTAVRELPELIGHKKVRTAEIRHDLVVGSWRTLVMDQSDLEPGCVDKHAYALCVLEALHKALRHREVYARGSKPWGDPRAHLLSGESWQRIRPQVLTGLNLSEDAHEHLDEQATALDTAWRDLGERLQVTGGQGSVRVEPGRDGRAQMRMDALGKLDEPASLTALRECAAAMLPPVDLPELLLEVHAHTGFLSEFTHAAGGQARMVDADISLAAVLVAEATNVGYKPVARDNHPALSRSRLSHTEQNYLRTETLKAANARLIEAQADIPLARAWGGGMVASIDGLRFVVPTQTVHSGHNPRYFGRKRGATWLNAINDQVAGIGATVVPGTQRDSLHQLDVLLNPDHGRDPSWSPRIPPAPRTWSSGSTGSAA